MGYREIGASGGGGTPTPTLPDLETGQFGLTAGQVSVTAGNNVLGSYTSLGTLTEAVDELVLMFTSTINRAMVINIRSGGATVVVDEVHFYLSGNNVGMIRLPVHLPAGALEIALAANSAGAVTVCAFATQSSPAQTATAIARVIDYTGTTLTSGLSISEATATFTAVGSPLAADAVAVIPFVGVDNLFVRIASIVRVDVSIDGATTLASYFFYQTSNNVNVVTPIIWGDFPAGTQLYMRLIPASANSNTCNVNFAVVR